eukprot:CAMPEP_0197036538 /NCGR_PEP_ID=MMETSP1384-20130603/14017_1 /TAXON_ID=29189 /ORGANISM="Ammonia sp." /LENGTH=565 /DNA_ID=CAMNT_0042466727 /DNA_START=17 /DNA_END=1714 /DNA_ORIENTATION=+
MASVKRTLATVGLTAVETAVVKATFDDDERPKNKHIRTICDYVELELAGTGYDTHAQQKHLTLVEMFRKRVNSTTNNSLSWRVVIKSLITIHILFRECDIAFIDEFSQYGQIRVFVLTKSFVDNTNSNSIVHSTFTRKYGRYLSDKLDVYKQLSYNVERKLGQNNKDFFKEFDVNTLGKILPAIMKQLHSVIEVQPQINGATFTVHALVREAMLLLIKDSLRIYSSIQLILWELLCSFQKLNLEQAKWISKTYHQYFELNTRYQEWFDQVVRLGIVNHEYAPKFNTLPESLGDKLSKYISDQEKLKTKNKKKKKKKKKGNKKKRKSYDEEDDDEEDEPEEEENDTAEQAVIGNLEDILDENELDDFAQSAKQYRQQKQASANVPQQNATTMQKEEDLLGFSDIFSSTTGSPITEEYKQNSANFVQSLNLKTPLAVNKDQFEWSNWGTLGDDDHLQVQQTHNVPHNHHNNEMDDFWSSVPAANDNANNGNNNNNRNPNMNGNANANANANGNTNFAMFATDLGGNNMQYNNNANSTSTAMSGGQARVLKKKQNPNADPFLDLLNLN